MPRVGDEDRVARKFLEKLLDEGGKIFDSNGQ